MKKIALFSDGTGNSSSNPQKTNVWRAYQALDRRPASHQIAFYDNGVGTSSFKPAAILGLALGWGLARNVRQIYGFVCRTYDPGDEIYGFGFSRGAFTMRVAIALIASQGIIDRNVAKDDSDLDQLIAAAYHRFRQDNFTPSFLSFFLRPVRDRILNAWRKIRRCEIYDPERNIRYLDGPDDEPLIKFVGVWDTVDAYGLPVDELTRAWDKVVWPLTAKDRNMSSRVARACHALALDEQRESFEPTLWNEAGNERVSQVWFAGVHANVGGGYPDDSLAFNALNWILDESAKNGGLTYLSEERRRFVDQADPNGPIYDNRKGLGSFYRYAPRSLERLCHEKKPGLANWLKGGLSEMAQNKFDLPEDVSKKLKLTEIAQNEVNIDKPKIHHSVFKRLRESGDAYAPINLPDDYAVVYDNGDIVDISSSERRLPETPDQAKDRRTRQSYVWNKVWVRQLLYFMTLIVIFILIFYPSWRDEQSSDLADFFGPLLGTFSFVIRAIPELIGKIPGLGFAKDWAESYAAFPYAFSIFVIVIGGLLWASGLMSVGLKSEMRANWHHVTQKGVPPPAQDEIGKFKKWLAGLLDSRPNGLGSLELSIGDRIARAMRIALEGFAVVFFVVLVLLVGSRIFLVAADGFGGVCEPCPIPQGRKFGQAFEFDPKNTCFDIGLELEKGKRYAIDMRISNDWSDKGIYADVNRWRSLERGQDSGAAVGDMQSPPWYSFIFAPLRRHLLAEWYQPIATIGDDLFDRYPLHQETNPELENDTGRQMSLHQEFTARRTDRLYLYLNDAVLFLPGFVGEFYDNNNGSAWVKVTELKDGSPSAGSDAEFERDGRDVK